MTDAQLAELERKRREREDELILLLLLLLGYGVSQAFTGGETGTETVQTPQSGPNASLDRITNLLRTMGVEEIAGSMADVHLDAFGIYQPGMDGAPPRDALIRDYNGPASDMANAMADTLTKAFNATGGDIAEALLQAKYSLSNSRNIEVGVERNIITASNAGVIDGAISFNGVNNVTGLEHISVLDDRTTHWCRPRNGLKLAVSNPYWETNWPTLHGGCRSVIAPLTRKFQDMSAFIPGFQVPDIGYGQAPLPVMAILKRAQRAG